MWREEEKKRGDSSGQEIKSEEEGGGLCEGSFICGENEPQLFGQTFLLVGVLGTLWKCTGKQDVSISEIWEEAFQRIWLRDFWERVETFFSKVGKTEGLFLLLLLSRDWEWRRKNKGWMAEEEVSLKGEGKRERGNFSVCLANFSLSLSAPLLPPSSSSSLSHFSISSSVLQTLRSHTNPWD